MRYQTYAEFCHCCPQYDALPVLTFLDYVAKNATEAHLKELALYTLSTFGARILGLTPAGGQAYSSATSAMTT